MKRLLLAVVVLLSVAPARALDRYVAVREVTGIGDAGDRAFLAKLSAGIRAAAIEELRGRYQVMMPDNIEEILRRSGKKGQEIMLQCGESSCAAQFGQILGADLVVAGSFAQLEGMLDLTVEVYDVATANVLGTGSVRTSSKLELVDRAFEATRSLLRRAVPAPVARAPASRQLFSVVEFRGPVDGALLAQLSDEVRAAAMERADLLVLSRDAIVETLRALPPSALAGLTEDVSGVELGRMIGANLVATGEVRKVGKALFLSMKLHETKTARTLVAKNVQADVPELLVERCRAAAGDLLRSVEAAP